MYDEEIGVSYAKINDILNGTQTLADKYEIEGVLLAMHQMDRKIGFLKELKKRRVAAIDEQIKSEESSIEKLEEAIKDCMKKNQDKTLDFPGVGKVQVRNTKGTWIIVDKDGLKTQLEALNKFQDVSEQSWDFKKKDLNKLLDELKKNNNVPAAVKQEDDRTSLSVSFPKEQTQPVVEQIPNPNISTLSVGPLVTTVGPLEF